MSELLRTEGGRLRCANFTGKTVKRVCLIAGPSWVSRIDEWRRGRPDLSCLSEAVRQLVDQGARSERHQAEEGGSGGRQAEAEEGQQMKKRTSPPSSPTGQYQRRRRESALLDFITVDLKKNPRCTADEIATHLEALPFSQYPQYLHVGRRHEFNVGKISEMLDKHHTTFCRHRDGSFEIGTSDEPKG